MFEQAGAVDAANDMRQELERLATLTETYMSPETHGSLEAGIPVDGLFDIPNFLDQAVSYPFRVCGWQDDRSSLISIGTKTWDNELFKLSTYTFS
jgi:hypothetical protein